jgi:hypothetical protein
MQLPRPPRKECYLSECEHTFNILGTERNNTSYKGKHVQYKIALASTVTRGKSVEIEATIEKLLRLRYTSMK